MKCLSIALTLLVSLSGIAQNSDFPSDFLSKDFHKDRREKLREKLPLNSVAVFLPTQCAIVLTM